MSEPIQPDRSPAASSRRAQIVESFNAAWQRGELPEVDAYLAAENVDRPVLLVGLLQVDQEQRLQRGEPIRVEDYLQRYPQLANASEELLGLVIAEYQLRQRLGSDIRVEEYCRRFPKFQDRLRVQDQVLQQCAARSSDPAESLHQTLVKPPEPEGNQPAGTPAFLGRYQIKSELGRGGFGIVYRGYDDQLRREVAIKVPHRNLIESSEDVQAYLAEARILASLDHAHIVPVYDVGQTEDGVCFVVSKFIEGSDLAKRIKQAPPTRAEAAELVATIAEALHYAHRHGLVHRDVKSGNILLDATGKPYLADFGLALKDEDIGRRAGFAGTPAYMSPEQARGEGHRVDGRSDIFSLGVVFYELLTGRRPFRGKTLAEVLEQIKAVEARPPRQVDDIIPKEMERICLKALAKRATERYTTARDLADDLRHFLSQSVSGMAAAPAVPTTLQPVSVSTATPAGLVSSAADQRPIKIVPKGLRSFDANDADFFLELLPGPRDREGLPESLRFWKSRIEETDPDQTFSVGLIYGPSGCGKSSLVKAGLLPRLAHHVLVVYIEATADDTESRLLRGLRKHCPNLPTNLGLAKTLAELRRGQGISADQKVLIVLDQFEQWLHARQRAEDPELVRALRQCDGERVQCVVLVRDDFWLVVSRFLTDLEIDILQGKNTALVDLFDQRHAKKVLRAFGRAFGALPEGQLSKESEAFLEHTVKGLSQDGKVVPVRLALFAEMVKSRSWTPATLNTVGGTEGVGVSFLEETFSSVQANPKHRQHQKAARAVLKALLPERGTDIKGNMQPRQELLRACGYSSRPRDFEELLRILDSDVRLITPTDPEGMESDKSSTGGEKYYQLTHDYLVPSLREWLTRKQKETWRGRAELRLADRAALWTAKPENRHLPAWWEWANIQLFTRKKDWAPFQKKMMRKATRYHALRGLLLVAFLALWTWGGLQGFGHLQDLGPVKAEALRDRLVNANTADVPAIVADMVPYRQWTDPLLREAAAEAEANHDLRKQLHVSLALLPVDPTQVEYLYGRLLDAEADQVVVLREMLLPYKKSLIARLGAVVEKPTHGQESRRLRAAAALAIYDPDHACWQRCGYEVALQLAAENPMVLKIWTDALQPARGRLLDHLATIMADPGFSEMQRFSAMDVFAAYAADHPQAFAKLEKHLTAGAFSPDEQAQEVFLKEQVCIAAALLRLERGENVWPLLKHSPDPTVRSYLVERLIPAGVDARVLVKQLEDEAVEISIRRALLLSLGQFELVRFPPAERELLLAKIFQIYRGHPDSGLHGAADWLLRQWKQEFKLKEMDLQLALATGARNAQWYVTRQGQTMVVVNQGPVDFLMGSPPAEPFRGKQEKQHWRHIGRSYAVAAKVVTVEQFLRWPWRKKAEQPLNAAPSADCPVTQVTWYEAAGYCNWLSQQEGIPLEQWCYLCNDKGEYAEGMKTAAGYVQRTGYRLPTEAEWEYACRARTRTMWCSGRKDESLGGYAWYLGNSGGRSHPVGTRKPNDFGLFDMHGNGYQWCQDEYGDYPAGSKEKPTRDDGSLSLEGGEKNSRVCRGAAFDSQLGDLRSASRSWNVAAQRFYNVGFRPARTFR